MGRHSDKAGDDNGPNLTSKHRARCDLRVVSHLLILHVVVTITCKRPRAQSLREEESVGVAGEHVAGDDLDQRAETQVGSRRRREERERDGEDQVDGDHEERDPDGCVERVDAEEYAGDDDGGYENQEEPPVGDLLVLGHKSAVDVHCAIVVAFLVTKTLVEINVGCRNCLPLVACNILAQVQREWAQLI